LVHPNDFSLGYDASALASLLEAAMLKGSRRRALFWGVLLLVSTALQVSSAQQRATTPLTARLNLRMVDEEREQPLPGVRISIEAGVDAQSIGISGKTDPSGRLQLTVPDSTPLSVSAIWFTHFNMQQPLAIAPLAAGENRELTLRLPSRFDAEMHVRLVDIETGLPVSNARARVLQSLQHLPAVASGARAHPAATTDGNGRLVMQFPSRHGLLARVTAAGYGPTDFRLARGITTPTEPLLVRLSRPATLAVNVTTAAGGVEPGLDVVVAAHSLKQPRGLSDDAMTSEVPMPRKIEWRAKTSGASAVLQGLVANVPLDLTISRSGKVLHRAQVVLGSAERRNYAWSLDAPVPAAKAPLPGRISGRLIADNGQPIANRAMTLTSAGSNPYPARYFRGKAELYPTVARTDSDGRFTFDAVVPGAWFVGPVPNGVWESGALDSIPDDPAAIAPLAEPVLVRSGAEATITLRRARGLYVRGHLIDAEDAAVANATISMTVWMLGTPPRLSTRTAADGSFLLGPLDHTGEVGLSANVPLLDNPRRIVPGNDDVVLRVRNLREVPVVETRGRLRTRLVNAASGAEVLAAVDVLSFNGEQLGDSLYLVVDGTFVQTFSPRRWLIVARTATGGFGQQWVEVRPGIEQSTEVRVKPGTWLTLRYVNEQPGMVRLLSQDQPKNHTGNDDLLYHRDRVVVAPGSYSIQFLAADMTVLLQSQLVLEPGEREYLVDLKNRTMRAAAD
jgi:hypothetical protein